MVVIYIVQYYIDRFLSFFKFYFSMFVKISDHDLHLKTLSFKNITIFYIQFWLLFTCFSTSILVTNINNIAFVCL